ncbi:MAG: asnB [Cytophagaceae bacterium]|jgi:asparagine synthase (glutamine-hydrolysing)|nr:asnB [Cytophagaceae bacterium]
MCGISGILAFNQVGAFYMMNLAKSLDCLAQRGPDARGTYIEDRYAVGHRRLSIIDTDSRSNQPMKDESTRYVISFNGEIFNFQAIRDSLLREGVSFHTNSDTEVLLQSYIYQGVKAFEELVGFFAFAIYDTEEQELILCRDRYGIKPLVYYKDEDKLLFASEIKSIMAYNVPKTIDKASVHQYFQFNYVPPQHAVFEGVQKLTPGTYLRVKNREVTQHSYYQLPVYNKKTSTPSYEEAVKEFKRLMEQSVVDRLVADVPLGTFLSGGLDSSVITAIAASHYDNLHTFSIGFESLSEFDESKYALLAAKRFNTKHHVFQLTEQDFNDHLFKILDYIDEPFADSAMLPLYILSEKTAVHLKVALSGDGADELLGGYNKHDAELKIRTGNYPKLASAFFQLLSPFIKEDRSTALGNTMRRINRFNAIKSKSAADRYYALCLISPPEVVDRILAEEFLAGAQSWKSRKHEIVKSIGTFGKDMNDVFQADFETVLQGDMLYKTDMMSMANGLEVRVPFLDHRLVDFVMSLPGDYKIDGQRRKKIVRDAFGDQLPHEIVNRKKKGFDVPLQNYLYRNERVRTFLQECTQKDYIREQGIFDEKFAAQMVPLKGKVQGDAEMWWAYLVFQHWYKRNLLK